MWSFIGIVRLTNLLMILFIAPIPKKSNVVNIKDFSPICLVKVCIIIGEGAG